MAQDEECGKQGGTWGFMVSSPLFSTFFVFRH